MKKFLVLPVLFTLLCGTPAFAGLQEGLDAAQKGDFTTALKEWKPLAEQGNAIAQYNIGIMYLDGTGVTEDYQIAFKWLKLSADQGYTSSQERLGAMYHNGLGVTLDYQSAVKWYKLAAEQENTKAQFMLGLMYLIGRGVNQDGDRFAMWNLIAASGGNKDAKVQIEQLNKTLTPTEAAKITQLARDCVAKKLKDC